MARGWDHSLVREKDWTRILCDGCDGVQIPIRPPARSPCALSLVDQPPESPDNEGLYKKLRRYGN